MKLVLDHWRTCFEQQIENRLVIPTGNPYRGGSDSDIELFSNRKITQGLFKGLYNSTMELICLSDVIVRKGRSGQT